MYFAPSSVLGSTGQTNTLNLTCFIAIAILAIWAYADPLLCRKYQQFVNNSTPPYYLTIFVCFSNFLGIWLAVSFSFIGCIMVLLVFFAIQTRHVHIKHFKDTKKMNMFIFVVCIIYAIFIPLWLILSELGFHLFTAAYVCQSIAILAGAALCQVFLLLPKTIPVVYNCAKSF